MELYNLAGKLIEQTVIIACFNLLAPLILRRHLRFTIIIAFIFLINVLILDIFYYYEGGIETVFFISKFITLKLHLEPLGLLFLTLVSFLWPIALIYTISFLNSERRKDKVKFLFFINLSIFFAILSSLSANMITLFISYEMLTIATIPLIMEGPPSIPSVKKYFTILMSTSLLLLLPAIIIITQVTGTNDFVNAGIFHSVDNTYLTMILLVMVLLGCAKAAIFPVYGWLPEAMVATHPVSALLHAVAVVKTGLFVIIKFIVYIFGINYLQERFGENNYFILLPIFTIFIASIKAIRESNLKKILAYSTIKQVNYSILAALMFTKEGIIAAMLHMFSHALNKIILFYSAGIIYTNSRKNNLSDIRGVGYSMPRTSIYFVIASISLIGITPLPGYISKTFLCHALKPKHYVLLFAIIFGSLTTAIYMFRIIRAAYAEKENTEKEIKRFSGMNISIIMIFSLYILYILYYKYIIQFINLIEF